MDAALVILDGWGLGSGDPAGGTGGRDAVAAAETPTVDRLRAEGAFTTLTTHGGTVGLPADQMGNSEVGHLTIGAGQVVEQESARIQAAVDEGRLGDVEAIETALDRAEDGRLHLLGLVSDGGVHASQEHLHALIRAAAERGVEAVTHAFTDGRDTDPTSGRDFLAELEAVADEAGTGHVASVAGRYYAMDRDRNWERTRRAYDAIVDRDAAHRAASAVEAVEAAYDRGETDEFVTPTLVGDGRHGADAAAHRPALRDGDAAIFVNYRADRARQLTRMLADIDPEWDPPTSPPDVHLVTMTAYDADFGLPVAFEPRAPETTLGEAVADAGLTQYRTAESEKYAHVTYFLNGGREVEFPGERREIVPSPDVPTYDERPEMSAATVTERAVATIANDPPDLLVLNYANPDMVGHTGDFDAAVAACEAVDRCLGDLETAVRTAGGHLLVTADHGNADDMGTPEAPHTAHTTNPVPAMYVAPDGTAAGRALREDGTLADVAPTVLGLLDVEVPAEMTGRSLLD
jgi:2,3-bisphosphoglycerate-independent phosphoglycerate mutase